MTKIGIIAFHLILSAFFGLFVGWVVSIDGPLSSFTFWAGFFMGALFYFIFVIIMLMLLDRWADEDE